MMRGPIAALIVAIPSMASAYSLTVGGEAVDDQPSRFTEIDLGRSSFVERPSGSDGSVTAESSSFTLTNMDANTRLETERSLAELGARQDGDRIVVNLPSDVLFDFDKHDIRADAQPVLSRLAGVLNAMPDTPVTIIGHTDAKGSDDYNQRLSEHRAASVEAWLATIGVRSSMATTGKGEALPVAPNQHADGSDDPEGRQKNRRVEFIIGGTP